jgi:Ca-activated chloride channel family protein
MSSPAIRPVGLLVKDVNPTPIPLVGVSVEALLKDFSARVVVSQRYQNREERPIEAVYVFPLEEGAAVCGFEAVIDGVRVVGEVQEKEKAFETYDNAMAEGHGAYLLDQERPDVFTASIGNIPPGREVLVRITYVAELTIEEKAMRFALPTTVSPRYAPQEDQQGVGRTPAETLNPDKALVVPYGLTLTVDLDMHAPLRSVASPSHPISVDTNGARGRVTLGGRAAALDRDFVLNVQLAEEVGPWARVERDPRGRYVGVVSFVPAFEVQEAAAELIFVVDRSGSMQGTSIEEARNALQLCLRSLNPGTRFNIVGFGSRFVSLFSESRTYDDASLQEASRHIQQLEADLGGTEILPPLESVFARPADPERPRQLFILTDGQVTNTEAVISLVRRNSGAARVFTFGIGAGASHHLVRGMARAGGGSAEFIAPGERIEAKVLRQLRKALVPAVSDVSLDWGGLKVTQAPHHVPPCFAGGRLVAYAFLDSPQSADVTLRGRTSEGIVEHQLRLDPERAEDGALISVLAARTLICDLEEGMSPLHDRRGSRQERGQGADAVKEAIVRLGVEHGLCSKYTSFVAVERREGSTTGDVQLRRIPVALTSGWGGERVRGVVPGGGGIAGAGAVALRKSAFAAVGGGGTPMRSRIAPSSARPLDRLVALQGADGSWDLTEGLATLLGVPPRELEELLGGAIGDEAVARRAVATALAVRWLHEKAATTADEWSLLEAKARRWLSQCSARPAGGGEWAGHVSPVSLK